MRFPKVSPEVDTIRIWFYLEKTFDLEKFFVHECRSSFASFQVRLDEDGTPLKRADGIPVFDCCWEKFRADMACSWWCKMQITVATSCAKSYWGVDYQRVLQVEYSVAKWHNITNGVNRGVRPSRVDIFKPIFECLSSLHLDKYKNPEVCYTWQKVLLSHFQVRRLDLSYNFIFPDVPRLMAELSVCRLNNKKGDPIVKDYSTETINFGGTRGSLYKAMFYDKEKEQKNFFSKSGVDNSLDMEQRKQEFYKKNKDLFKNVIRFEVQYHSKYFSQHFKLDYKYRKSMATFDKIINLCSLNYGELLKKFDEQINSLNVRPESEYTLYSECMNKLEDIRLCGGLSDTQCGTLKQFVEACFKYTWEVVRSSMSQQTFSVKYCKIKKLTGMDLKCICVTKLPIMRIMESEGYSSTWQDKFKILPSYIRNFAV